MIGRADIEGSKRNITKNTQLQQPSYPYGNFFNTIKKKFQLQWINNICFRIFQSIRKTFGFFLIISFLKKLILL